MKYTYIHILIQEKFLEQFYQLFKNSGHDCSQEVHAEGSCYYFISIRIDHLNLPDVEATVKSVTRDLIELSSDIVYRIEKI